MCKRWQAFLSAGLAVTVCGMAARPAMAQTASITFLNDFTNSTYYDFWLNGMSDDASVIVGYIGVQGSDGSVVNQAFRWTMDTGIVFLAPPPGYGPDGTVIDVSADGTNMIASFSGSPVWGRFSWTAAGGFVDIGSGLPGGTASSSVNAISADGSTIVGASRPAPDMSEAFSLAGDGTVYSLGDLPSGSFQSIAFDVSGDGSVVVGNGTVGQDGFDFPRATRWTMNSSGDGYDVEVPDFASETVCDLGSRTWAVSEDGTVAMGEVTTVDGTEVFRWTADGGVDLPFRSAGKSASYSRLMSTDGSLIAGAPGLWVEATNSIVTLGDIQDTLVNDFGVDMGGWDITTTGSGLEAISATPQGVIFLGRIQFSVPGGPNGAKNDGLPYIIRLPYLPIGTAPEPTCSATWESEAIGHFGLSVQPPWDGVNELLSEDVEILSVFDDGNGPALYAGGLFRYAGGNLIGNGIAKWDGQSWSPLGIGMGGPWPIVDAMVVFDDGTGPALYVGGSFTSAGGVFASSVAKWDGQQWSAVGAGIPGAVNSLEVYDDGSGPTLYASGPFSIALGGPGNRVAKWDGSQWVAVGGGIDNCNVFDLQGFDDGSGMALYAVGCFDSVEGGQVAPNIAKWDGTQWSPVGGGVWVGSAARDMAVWDDGSGSALYVTGSIASVGGDSAISGTIRWNGQNWSAVGSDAVGGEVVKVVDDGTGPALLMAGTSLRKWDGQSWSDMAPFGCGGVSGFIEAVAEYDDGLGNGICLGGDFLFAGSDFSRNIAMLRACTVPHPGDCNADGVVDMMDFDLFSGCLSGPDGGLGTGCECSDVNGDGDVDLGDFQAFMASFTG